MSKRIFTHHRLIQLALSALLLFGTVGSSATEPDDAKKLLSDMFENMLSSLRDDGVRNDEERVVNLVDEVLIPHIDFTRVSRLVLAKHWRAATTEQRSRFAQEFRGFLIRFYSSALSEYAKNNSIPESVIAFESVRGKPGDKQVVVKSKVRQPNGAEVDVNYRMYLVKGAWKVIDVSVGGVSMVTNYRTSFGSEIRKSGLDSLIEKLATRNKKLAKKIAS